MPSSLGVFIDNNIIKYAKLQKDKDDIKIEAFNIVFVEDNIEETIKRIISETYSFQIPVSTNLSDEIYSYFDISNLLNKQDAKKAINIEYEMLCSEKGYNQALLTNNWLKIDKKEEAEKQKVINIVANKNEIEKRVALFTGNKVTAITPMPLSIINLLDKEKSENAIIVNIESKTQITTVVEGEVYSINIIDDGMSNILDEINKIENSYSKAYEACKNMTIYTQGASDLYTIADPYMSIVSAELLKIIDQVKSILNNSFVTIDKIYITGTAVCINNIDLYFQDYITSTACEILRPYFLKNVSENTSLKEYIDANSAIALALSGVNGVEINFAKGGKKTLKKSGTSFWKKEISLSGIKSATSDMKYKIAGDFTSSLQSSEKLILRCIFAIVIMIIAYITFGNSISKQITEKNIQVKKSLAEQQTEISKIDSDISIISERATYYNNEIQKIKNPTGQVEISDSSNENEDEKKRVIEKDSIPNLLNRIMFVIPKKVKVVYIKNTSENHIEIKAEAEKYEQLGYFKAVLTTSEILKNVKSTPGQKTGNIVDVIIEGDLP